MHIAFKHRLRIAAVLFVAAAAWPSVMLLWFDWTLSPLERAMATSICGGSPHQALAHCAACWTGAAALMLAALLVLASATRRPTHGWSRRAPSPFGLRAIP